MGSVANYRKQESWGSQVIGFPRLDFRILPQKGKFATEPRQVQRCGEALGPWLWPWSAVARLLEPDRIRQPLAVREDKRRQRSTVLHRDLAFIAHVALCLALDAVGIGGHESVFSLFRHLAGLMGRRDQAQRMMTIRRRS